MVFAVPSLLWLAAPVPVDRVLDEPSAAAALGEKYVGVAPGAGGRNPLPGAAATSPSPRLIWSGFQMAEQGSRVFFQTTGPVTFDVASPQGKRPRMSVFLRNCRIHLKNNRRNLDTRYFATPVAGVSAVQRRKDVELRIALKEPASATPRTEAGPDGTQFVVLDFPPGRPAADPPPRAPAESADPSADPAAPPAPTEKQP